MRDLRKCQGSDKLSGVVLGICGHTKGHHKPVPGYPGSGLCNMCTCMAFVPPALPIQPDELYAVVRDEGRVVRTPIGSYEHAAYIEGRGEMPVITKSQLAVGTAGYAKYVTGGAGAWSLWSFRAAPLVQKPKWDCTTCPLRGAVVQVVEICPGGNGVRGHQWVKVV